MRTALSASNRRGYLLIESMVAVGLITVGLLGVVRLFSSSISLNRDVTNRFTASFLAGEGIEVIRSIIDESTVQGEAWNTRIPAGLYEVTYDTADLNDSVPLEPEDEGQFLLFHEDIGVYDYDPSGTATSFKRAVAIEDVDPNHIFVRSSVSWTERGGIQEIDVEDHFFNWR